MDKTKYSWKTSWKNWKRKSSRNAAGSSTTALTLYADGGPNAFKAQIVAEYLGVKLTSAADFQIGVSNKTEEFLKLNPTGKVPVLDTLDGPLFESNAIARYVAKLKKDNSLLGTTPYELALIDQWIDFSSFEISNTVSRLTMPKLGYSAPSSAEVEDATITTLKKSLTVLNGALASRTFIVGNYITLADIILFCDLYIGFRTVFSKEFSSEFPQVEKYFWTLLNQPAIKNVVGELKQGDVDLPEHEAPVAAPSKATEVEKLVAAPKPKEEAVAADEEEEAPKPKEEAVAADEEEEAPKHKEEAVAADEEEEAPKPKEEAVAADEEEEAPKPKEEVLAADEEEEAPNLKEVLAADGEEEAAKPKEEVLAADEEEEAPKPKEVLAADGEEEAPKPKEALAVDEEVEAPKPKVKNPLDLLPPSSFVIDNWKRLYSNTKDKDFAEVAIKGFWEMYDPEGWSFWFADYKYNEENHKTYVTMNKVGGFLQRLDFIRKYAFGKVLILGETAPYKIKGVWLFRGQDIPQQVLDECYDAELYTWSKADLNNEEQKARINTYFEEPDFVDGEPLLEARCFK